MFNIDMDKDNKIIGFELIGMDGSITDEIMNDLKDAKDNQLSCLNLSKEENNMTDYTKNEAVISLKDIINKKKHILYVSHDAEDGAWQFLDGGIDHHKDDAVLVSLQSIIDIDNSVKELLIMPLGHKAERSTVKEKWIIGKL